MSIWSDLWLPGVGLLTEYKVDGFDLVCDLFDLKLRTWKMDVLQFLFPPFIMNAILVMPFS